MKNLLDRGKKLADQAEIHVVDCKEIPVTYDQNTFKSINKKNTRDISLRLIKDSCLGFASTTHLNDTEVVDRALEQAPFGEDVAFDFPAEHPAEDTVIFDQRLSRITEEDLIEHIYDTIDAVAAYDASIPLRIQFISREITVQIANTNGLHQEYKKTALSASIYTLSPQGFIESICYYAAGRLFRIPDGAIKNLIQRHQQAQTRLPVPTKKMPVIFTPRAFGALIYRLLEAIKGTNLNTGVSPLEDQLGETIFDTNLNLKEEPHKPYGLFSCPVDDEGIPTQGKEIITAGILKSFLYDLKTGTEAGKESTGNGFKRSLIGEGFREPPTPHATNLFIPPGTRSLNQLINQMEEGLLVDTVMGAHTGNIFAGEFSLNVGCGYYIKNGNIQGKAVDTMVSGNIYEVLQEIPDYSSELGLLFMFEPMGYGPDVLVSSVSVTGKMNE